MLIEFTRDYALYAGIFGFFSMAWFGWAQDAPPKSWRIALVIGSVLATLVTMYGVFLAVTNWDMASSLQTDSDYQAFGLVVGLEVGFAALGSYLLSRRKLQHYIAPWIALVVGLHFFPLVWIFHDTALLLLTALATAIPIAAVYLARRTRIAPSALTGVGMGVLLLAFAMRGLYMLLV